MKRSNENTSLKPDPCDVDELYNNDNRLNDKKPDSKSRYVKHDKEKKFKRKKKVRYEQKCHQYDEILRDQLVKKFARTKSPHVVLSNKTFNDMKLNVIMLTNPRIEKTSKTRNIYYDIKWMGDNIVINKKGKYHNLVPSRCPLNKLYLTIAIHELVHFDNLLFFTEKDVMIPDVNVNPNRHGYVLLAFIYLKKTWTTENILLNNEGLDISNKFFINQVKQNQGNYHYGISGTVFGLGYGPKFHRNEHGHSVDRFSNSESKYHLVIS